MEKRTLASDTPGELPGDSIDVSEQAWAAASDETANAELAGEAGEEARQMPFRADTNERFIPGATYDQLTPVQSSAGGAARMSGRHIANLLYSPGSADTHTAPYGARYSFNYGEATREGESTER